MEKTVYILRSESAGYWADHGVFRDRKEAVDCAERLTEQVEYNHRTFYIQPRKVL